MPAMSPTMTEGNITSWKMKEGESYSAGDVILEIETDKATMDVEAQDDGVLAKILIGDGNKGISVGTNIAVMAEPDDDLNNLELPSEEPSKSETKPSNSGESKQEVRVKKDDPAKKSDSTENSSSPTKAHQTNKDGSTLSPAVQSLLILHGINDAHAVPATGPKGRLLKGDILAYAKQIDAKSTKSVADAYIKRGKLDLSNIKKAPRAPTAETQDEPEVEKNPVIEIRKQVDLIQLILLSEKMTAESGVEMSVQQLAAKAAERALLDVPMFGVSPVNTYDTLFDEIITGRKHQSSRQLPPLSRQRPAEITLDAAEYFEGGDIKLPARAPASTLLTLQAASPVVPQPTLPTEYDLIDFLVDKPTANLPTASQSFGNNNSASAMIASLSFNQDSVNVGTATTYLDRLSQYVESPAHLFL
ncbi:Putative uncharacterized protein [Taphrina deformans PYCC 5710]|uniref:Pyruvate dehydrogenase protein x component n=1 Tax=Taphrina deformans (strain PYCC 5710 / ATCC 11124 / CBS 356.35 / IMI 108563 / JCM 9778 / NBRC 8474) TaxID=1097556 RepID=R4XBE7_TAPDE|nr:Putative uncharacterized protein [Taphrina deformans PYCC 5710]|eukprot:CCG83108.1 Putative uncharacterized protein [Taphrina deformans PYCC 5710]